MYTYNNKQKLIKSFFHFNITSILRTCSYPRRRARRPRGEGADPRTRVGEDGRVARQNQPGNAELWKERRMESVRENWEILFTFE